MKRKNLLIVVLLVIAGSFFACEKIPKDVKPIDWENYNDVYTVYWNCYSSCKEIKNEYAGKTVKISGWRIWSRDLFSLCDDAKCAEIFFVPSPLESVVIDFCFPEAQTLLDTSDLTKKCLIKGKIRLKMEKMSGCKVFPVIEVTDINDIYFD
jgi:hypothetical protein